MVAIESDTASEMPIESDDPERADRPLRFHLECYASLRLHDVPAACGDAIKIRNNSQIIDAIFPVYFTGQIFSRKALLPERQH